VKDTLVNGSSKNAMGTVFGPFLRDARTVATGKKGTTTDKGRILGPTGMHTLENGEKVLSMAMVYLRGPMARNSKASIETANDLDMALAFGLMDRNIAAGGRIIIDMAKVYKLTKMVASITAVFGDTIKL
jgi:hypothetical protein